MEVSIHYDPMIAKLIIMGETREIAIQRMIRAIEDYVIVGVETTLEFGKFVLNHPQFLDGNFNTHFVENHFRSNEARKGEYDQLTISLHSFSSKESKYINCLLYTSDAADE